MQSEKPIHIHINGTYLGYLADSGIVCLGYPEEDECIPAISYLAAVRKYYEDPH